jgi:hypothetical protein
MKQQLRIFFLYLLVTSPLLSDGPEVPDVQKIIDQAIAGTSASQPLTPPEAIIIQPEEIKTVLLQDIATVEQGKVPKEFEQVKTPEPFKQIKIIKNGTDTLLVGVGSSDGFILSGTEWIKLEKPDATWTEVTHDGTVWAADKNNKVWRRDKTEKTWQEVPGAALTQVAVGNKNEVWGLSAKKKVARKKDAAALTTLAQASWHAFPGQASSISCGGDGSVWVVGATDQVIYRFKRSILSWTNLVHPNKIGLGSPKQIDVADKFNIVFVDVQGRLWKYIPNKNIATRDGWQLLADFGCIHASISSDGTIVCIDKKGSVFKRNPSEADTKAIEAARGKIVSTNQVSRIVSVVGGKKIWTLADSPYDAAGEKLNPPATYLDLVVGSATEKRQDIGCFVSFNKTGAPTQSTKEISATQESPLSPDLGQDSSRSAINFGDTVTISSLYASPGKTSKAGAKGREWKWWVHDAHQKLGASWRDIIVSLTPPTDKSLNEDQEFKIVSPYGLVGPIHENDIIEFECMTPHARGSKLLTKPGHALGQAYDELIALGSNVIDQAGSKSDPLGSRDHSGAQWFYIQPITQESDVPAHAQAALRMVSDIPLQEATQASADEKAGIQTITGDGTGLIVQMSNASFFPLNTSAGVIDRGDIKKMSYKLTKPFTISGYVQETDIPKFEPGTMLSLKPTWGGIAWLGEPIATANSGTLTFLARAADDGNIQIHFSDKTGSTSIFQVIIGGWNNTKSAIVMNNKIIAETSGDINPFAKAHAGQVLPYWISINNNFVLVGAGEPGDYVFLSGFLPLPKDKKITRVGLGSHATPIDYTELQFGQAVVTQEPPDTPIKHAALSLPAEPGNIQYLDNALRVQSEGAISFQAQAKHSVTVVLENNKQEAYKITIGGNGNKETIVSKNNDQVFSIKTDILPVGQIYADRPNSYWVSIDGEKIMVGNGALGEGTYFVWHDSSTPITRISKIGFMASDHAQTIDQINLTPPCFLGSQKQKFSYKKKLPRKYFKTPVQVIRPIEIVFYQNGPKVSAKNKISGVDADVFATPMQSAEYKMFLSVDAQGLPSVSGVGKTMDPIPKLALDMGAQVISSAADVAMMSAQMITKGSSSVSMLPVVGQVVGLTNVAITAGIAGTALGAKIAAAGMQAASKRAFRSHDSYVFKEQLVRDPATVGTVPPEAKNNEMRVRQLVLECGKYQGSAADFEKLVASYQEIMRRINHPSVLSSVATRTAILRGLSGIATGYKSVLVAVYPPRIIEALPWQLYPTYIYAPVTMSAQGQERLHGDVMNLFINAILNPYLYEEKEAAVWFNAINEIGTTILSKADEEPLKLSPLYGEYLWLPLEFPEADSGGITFEVRASNDVFIAFAQEARRVRNSDNQLYEIVFGGWENSQHEIHVKSLGRAAASVTREQSKDAMLNPAKFTPFWATLQNGIIRLGKGELGQNVLLEWKDPRPFKGIRYVGISNWDTPIAVKKNIQVFGLQADGTVIAATKKDKPAGYSLSDLKNTAPAMIKKTEAERAQQNETPEPQRPTQETPQEQESNILTTEPSSPPAVT